MKKSKIFSSLIDNKKENYSLIMTSVLVAVGVNILSTGIVDLLELRFGFQIKGVILIAIGTFLSLGVLAWNAWLKFKRLNQTKNFEGFIIYDEINHKIIGVPEYTISTDMAQYQQWSSSENKALEKLWNKDNISQFRNFRGKFDKKILNTLTQNGTLFTELLEYCLIEKLSLHLTDYFNKFDEKVNVQEFQKVDIPQVLLTNRFLRLFSENMTNRESFMCFPDNQNDDTDNCSTVCALNSSGAYYHKFDLTLPENSKISRRNKNEIIIDTPILTLSLKSLFFGLSTVISRDFYKYYLGSASQHYTSLQDYQFNVEISVKFKPVSLFMRKKTDIYYSWIDSFLDEITEYMEKDRFFDRIDWNAIHALIYCTNNINRLASKS